MHLSDLQSSLFTQELQTPAEKAALIAAIGSESPEALSLPEIRAVCAYLKEQLDKIAQDVARRAGHLA